MLQFETDTMLTVTDTITWQMRLVGDGAILKALARHRKPADSCSHTICSSASRCTRFQSR